MKIAYFDSPTGLSGNMIIGAMLNAGLDLKYLDKEIHKLKLKGYQFKHEKTLKNGVAATYFDVTVKDSSDKRSIGEIFSLIKKSSLSPAIKQKSIKIFQRLFNAESKVHGGHIHHLHETGATDAIIDIVGAVIGFERLGIKEVFCSPLPYGYGKINSEHGTLPNPAPATIELLKGIPIYKKNIKAELVTPTGAAIIAEYAESFTDIPRIKLEKIGLGAGYFDLNEPNILRLFIGESTTRFNNDLVVMIETNIDNLNPEFYDFVINDLMKAGALDAFISQIRMKKGRPGIILSVISNIDDKDGLLERIFEQTTTLGARTYLIKRQILKRKMGKVSTKYGEISVKIGMAGGSVKNISPEYEDCVRLSKRTGIPLKKIYDEARSAAIKAF